MDPWKRELVQLLDIYTRLRLLRDYENGVVTDKALFFLNLGIGPERLQALAKPINSIIRRHSKAESSTSVSVDDLADCHELGELFDLVKSKL